MDTTHLRYFVAVARAGSLSAASSELKVTQPALSVAVQRLESRLGTTLFHRHRDGMTLTATGRELLHHATDALALLGRAEERVRALEKEEVGRVVLGCAAEVAPTFVPSLFAAYIETWSGIDLELVNGCGADIVRAVLERRVELGVVANPACHEELATLGLYGDSHELFVAPELAPADGAAAAELVRRGPVIFVEGPEARALLDTLRDDDVAGEALHEMPCAALSLARALAAGRVGVAILPRRYAESPDPSAVVRLGGGLPTVPAAVALVRRRDLARNRAARRIEEAVVAHGKRLAAG